jgi:nucleotide-binding universal stress UspA family protein
MTYKIVVGVDASPHSTAALLWALEQAESRSGEVVALLSWQVPFFGMPGGFDHSELEAGAKALLLQTVQAVVPHPAVKLTTIVAEGDPIESLLAASKNAQLLVLGTRGRSRFAGLLLGSVSQACSAAASCPVVLVKKSDEPPPANQHPDPATAALVAEPR